MTTVSVADFCVSTFFYFSENASSIWSNQPYNILTNLTVRVVSIHRKVLGLSNPHPGSSDKFQCSQFQHCRTYFIQVVGFWGKLAGYSTSQ
jgi:hypothetical protein